jgi:hypothetical protein
MTVQNFIIQGYGGLLKPGSDFELNYSVLNYLDLQTTSRSCIAIIDNVPDLSIFCTTRESITKKYDRLKREVADYLSTLSTNIQIFTESVTSSYNYLPLPGNIEKAIEFFIRTRSLNMTAICATESMITACKAKGLNCKLVSELEQKYKNTPNLMGTADTQTILGLRSLQNALQQQDSEIVRGDNFIMRDSPINIANLF